MRRDESKRLNLSQRIVVACLIALLSIAYFIPSQILAEGKVRIGILQYAEHEALDSAVEGFKSALLADGFKEGENIEFVIKNSQGDISNAQTIADQFANDNFDLYLAVATPAAQSLANKIKDKPILATAVTDYVAAKLVDSNEKPNRNVSGTSDVSPLKEQAELIKEIIGDKFNLGIIYNSSEINSEIQAKMMKDIIENENIKVEFFTVSASNEIRQVADTAVQTMDAIYIPTDNLLSSSMGLIKNIQKETQKAFFVGEKSQVLGGGLATIGISYEDLGKQTAEMAKRILIDKANIAEMPIETAKDNKIYINKEAVDNLGIKLDKSLLDKASLE